LPQAKVDQILSARDRMRPFEEAAQKLDDETRLLTTLKLTLRQREIDFQVPKRTIEILNIAEAARLPSRPSWPLNLAFAGLFGVVLAVGTAVLLEASSHQFRNVADVESRLRLPCSASSRFRPIRSTSATDTDPADSEPYRVLHTNLNLALPTGKPSCFVMLSAGPGEGKSTTLHRLAKLMAAGGGTRDLDRCRFAAAVPAPPRRAARIARPQRTPHRRPAARSGYPARHRARPRLHPQWRRGKLHVEHDLRRIASANCVTTLRGRYDKIVFDSPPIIGVSDASVLAGAMDGAVLLIQHRRNPAAMVLRAQQIVTWLKTPLPGVVLNQVPARSGEDYGYYTDNYAYYSDGQRSTRRSHRRHQGQGGSGRRQVGPRLNPTNPKHSRPGVIFR